MLPVIFRALHQKLFDYDLWWHLASGRTMVETHRFLREDIFSHTLRGARWVNFEWLGQVLLYLVVKTMGLPAVLYGKIALGFAVVGLLTLLIRKHGARGPLLLLMVLTGFFTLRSRLYERIELASLLLMPVFVLALSSLRHATSENAKKIPWILFALMIVWANLHGGFIYGIGLAVLMAVGARWSNEKPETLRLFDRTAILLLVAMFFTPSGIHLPEIFIEHARQLSYGPQLIEEWAAPSMQSYPFFWALFVLSVAGLTIGLRRGDQSSRFWTPAVFVFALWGSRHQRNAAYLAFLALPFLAEILSRRWGPWLERRPVEMTGWVLCFAALFFLKPFRSQPPLSSLVIEDRFPIKACDFIKKNNIYGTMYNTYHIGGYIEWALGESYPVFMDGRYLFQPLLIKHNELDSGLAKNPDGTAWKNFLNSAGVDYAIVDYSSPIYPSLGRTPFPLAWQNLVFPRGDWALVYWDDAAMVFLKRTPAFAALIKSAEYKAIWPYNLDQMKEMINARMVKLEQVEKEIRRHEGEVGMSVIRQKMEELFLVDETDVA